MFDRAVVDSVRLRVSPCTARNGGSRGAWAFARCVVRAVGRNTYEGWSVDQDGKTSLRLALGGDLVLRCQRCLGPVKFRFDAVRNFVLVPAGQR